MEQKFKNKVVAITGGLGDIGKGIAKAFAEQGAKIAICDLHPIEKSYDFINSLKQQHAIDVDYHQLDVCSSKKVNEWIFNIENRLGTPEILIANAAAITPSSILDMQPEDWENNINVNLNGVFYVSQTVAKAMVNKQQSGYIIIMGSWAAHKVHPNLPSYSVAKAGLRMFCKCLGLELAPHKILVNELALGYVEAGLSEKMWKENPSKRIEAKNKVPVNELINVGAISEQILFLCDSRNKHITGTTILMDGGLSLL